LGVAARLQLMVATATRLPQEAMITLAHNTSYGFNSGFNSALLDPAPKYGHQNTAMDADIVDFLFDPQELQDLGKEIAQFVDMDLFHVDLAPPSSSDAPLSLPPAIVPQEDTQFKAESLADATNQIESTKGKNNSRAARKKVEWLDIESEEEVDEEEDEEWTGSSQRKGRRGVYGGHRRIAKKRSAREIIDDADDTHSSSPRAAVKSPKRRAGSALWRKYGQKNLKTKQWSGVVRCYYKCCEPGCTAKKLVEKRQPDLETITAIKYEQEHNHAISQSEIDERQAAFDNS